VEQSSLNAKTSRVIAASVPDPVSSSEIKRPFRGGFESVLQKACRCVYFAVQRRHFIHGRRRTAAKWLPRHSSSHTWGVTFWTEKQTRDGMFNVYGFIAVHRARFSSGWHLEPTEVAIKQNCLSGRQRQSNRTAMLRDEFHWNLLCTTMLRLSRDPSY
jgi:hypothetical protein